LTLDRLAAAWRGLLDFPGLAAMQNIHPLIVHFPIVFLSTAALLYWVAALSRIERLGWAAFWMLAAGAATATIAVWSGLNAGAGVMVAPSVRQHILNHHKQLMLATWAMSLGLLVWASFARPMPQRVRALFVIALLVMIVTLMHGVDYGGWMVFGYNAGGSLPQPIEFDH
jgi:uncharacterized membrane protein